MAHGPHRRSVAALAGALAFGLCPACLDQRQGITVDVQIRGAEAHFTTEAGEITLSAARITIWSTAISACPEAAWRLPSLSMGRAWAHSASDPLRSGVPVVVDLLGGQTPVAALTPPPGRWCALDLEIAPADADAVGLTREMEGRTFDLEGTFQPPGGDPLPFRVLGAPSLAGEIDLGGLDLSGATDGALVDLAVDLPRWFEGVELTDPAGASRRLAAQLPGSLISEIRP